MTALLTTVETGPNGGIKRDRYGRYRLPDPNTGEEKSWTRVTTLASTLADRFGLEQWDQRNVAWGIGQRQDLYARAASVKIDDTQTLNNIVKQAKEAARSSSGATLGSALHEFTERLDRGEDVAVPPPYDKDIAAYQTTLDTADIAVVMGWIERVVIVPELEVAGTLDRFVDGPWGPIPRVGDLKTGKDVLRWSMPEIAIQLALYAHGTHWWNGTGWEVMPPVDQDKAVVMHLPVGKGWCVLYEVDIKAGWEAAQLAADVRRWRKRQDLAEQIPAVAPAVPAAGKEPPDLTSGAMSGSGGTDQQHVETAVRLGSPFLARFMWVKTRVNAIKTTGGQAVTMLAGLWSQHDVPTFPKGGPRTDGEVSIVAGMCDLVETEFGLPFAPPDPTKPPTTKKETKTP